MVTIDMSSSKPSLPLTIALAASLPFAGKELLRFLAARAIARVEEIDETRYQRVFAAHGVHGTLSVELAADGSGMVAQLAPALAPYRDEITAQLRRLFDLDAPAARIDAQLAEVPLLAESVRNRPGLRVPGAFDNWELCARAVLGQQVTVKGASTLTGRLAEHFGRALPRSEASSTLRFGFPSAIDLAALDPEQVRTIGIPLARARTLVLLARLLESEPALLAPGAEVETALSKLQTIAGVGPWTAGYIAMRALKAADMFLPGDLAAKKALGVTSEREAELASQCFRPYRAYALMHLWASL